MGNAAGKAALKQAKGKGTPANNNKNKKKKGMFCIVFNMSYINVDV